MSNRVELDPEHWLTYRDTPWDLRTFGFRCAEIMDLAATGPESLAILLAQLETEMRAREIRFAYARVDGGSMLLKRGLQEAGFYFAEASYRVSHRNVQGSSGFDQFIRPGPQLVAAQEAHLDRLRDILELDFDYGRIHEDPYVSRAVAGARYRAWLDDLIAQGHEIYAYQLRGDVIGLHAQRRHGAVASLVVTGVARSHALLGLPLWAQVMRSLREQGVERAESLISAANLPILNLYRHFGFSFDGYVCGYHVRYE